MTVTPGDIQVSNKNSSALIFIATDEALRTLAKKTCNLEPKDFQNTLYGKNSLSKFLYYLYCQELKTFHLINNRRELLKNISHRLIKEQTAIQKHLHDPESKPQLQEEYRKQIQAIQRLERVVESLEQNIDTLNTKLQRVKFNRLTISQKFTEQAVLFKQTFSETLKNNGFSRVQEPDLNQAMQVLLGLVEDKLSEEQQLARLAEIPPEIKRLLEEKFRE